MVYMDCTFCCPTGKDELMFLKGEKEGGREGRREEGRGRAMS